ncbi:DNA/RNA polymerase [Rhizophagus irregularis]|uniref:DNA polymerase delta catalytic subunit n=1 Tax=Rhizophagus irregularis TaxID=588596 RepID=A0A2N1MIB5_9GLOM|nr:DNA/RNA polymerase [Rhizophagus irregularis]
MTEQSELSEFLDAPALFHPEAEKDKNGQVIRYSSKKYLTGIPTRDDIVAKNDDPEGSGLTAVLEDALSNCQEIPFMAVDIEGSSQKINGKYCYVLRLYSSLINGQKAVVTLFGIRVFFDIRVPDGESPDECEIKVRDILSGNKVETLKIEHIKAFPFRGYHTEKKPYLRIYISGTGKRKTAMQAIQDNNYETASDDMYSFYRKVARENGIQLSGWSMLSKYRYKRGIDPLCPHAFYTSKNDFRPVEDLTIISNRFPISALLRDRTLVLTWDIETQSQELGKFAEVLDLSDNAFMICMTLHWKDDPKPLKQICLVDVETEPDPGWTTIICGNQENLLKAFAICWRAFAPNIHVGFNDSDYDWRFIMERAYHLNMLEWMWERMTGKFETKEDILKWKYRGKIGAKSENVFKRKGKNTDEEGTVWGSGEEVEEVKEYLGGPIKIKITAEEDFYSSFLKLPGCVPIDVRVCLKKYFPKAEVEKGGSLKFFLKKCGLDTKADMPYDVMWRIYSEAKQDPTPSITRKMREVANYCIIDALHCQELLVKLSQINDYREVASIAHVSLFDSHYRANGMKVRNLLGAYAFKRDMLFSTRVCENIEKGKYPGAYVFPPKKGIETRRPVTGLDFASLYPSLIMAYNLSPDKIILTNREADIAESNGNILHKIEFLFNNRNVEAWSVRHNNQFEKKGLYPIVLKDLYNKRVELKAHLAPLGKKKRQLEKMISLAKERGKTIPESLISEYSSVCFNHNYSDSKQRALKVYMNTFYGEAGNSKSPIFLRELAGGTTSAGNTILYYGKCDEAFSRKELSKEAYWTEMVEITMNVMKGLRDQVNAYLRIKSGTSCLKMAYEEVLFPVCFAGIDTVKQGNSELFRFIGEKIMWEAMDINNTRSIHEIVKDVL